MLTLRLSALATLAISIALVLITPNLPYLPSGYQTPMIAFEFATSIEEIRKMFSASQPDILDGMDLANKIDFAFLITYPFLLYQFGKTFPTRVSSVLWIPCVIMAIADALENRVLFGITRGIRVGISDNDLQSWLDQLHIMTHIKWASIGISFILLSGSIHKSLMNYRMAYIWSWLVPILSIASYGACFNFSGVYDELYGLWVVVMFVSLIFIAFFNSKSKLKSA